MMQVIEKWTMQHTMDECLAMLDQAGIPSARFRDPAEALSDSDLADRGRRRRIQGRQRPVADVGCA